MCFFIFYFFISFYFPFFFFPIVAPGIYTALGRNGVHMDIERIFTVKVRIFGPVEFMVDSILTGILKVAFKALIETIRSSTLNRVTYLQVKKEKKRLGMGLRG